MKYNLRFIDAGNKSFEKNDLNEDEWAKFIEPDFIELGAKTAEIPRFEVKEKESGKIQYFIKP